MFYDDTKEGGCTINVYADEPGETYELNETDDSDLHTTEYENRISTNELSKVTNRKSDKLNGKLI